VIRSLLILVILLSGCAKPLLEPVAPLPIEEMFTASQLPPEEKSNWTTTNKLWFAAALAGQAADATTTLNAMESSYCREVNPLLGGSPGDVVVIGSKLALFGTALWFTEYYYRDDPRQQKVRNIVYGIFSVVGAGAGVWNYSQDCR